MSDAPEIAALLGEHADWHYPNKAPTVALCLCGFNLGPPGSARIEAHRAHVASVLEAHTADRVRAAAEKALRELAVRVEKLRRRNPMNGDGFNSAIDMVIARLGDEATLAAQAERVRLDDEYEARWYPRTNKEADQ